MIFTLRGRTLGLEDVAILAIPEVEFVTDNRPVHRVGAEDQLAVDNRMRPQVVRQIGSATPIPAMAVSFFRIHGADSNRDTISTWRCVEGLRARTSNRSPTRAAAR